MIEKINNKNKVEFESLLNKFWRGVTLEDCKKDAKTTAQFAYRLNNKLVGLLTCSIKREYVAGCDTNKVAYLEGLYVLPKYRKQKIATQLIKHFELWASKKGCTELASDLELTNKASLQFHNKMGFEVVEKTIHLKKEI